MLSLNFTHLSFRTTWAQRPSVTVHHSLKSSEPSRYPGKPVWHSLWESDEEVTLEACLSQSWLTPSVQRNEDFFYTLSSPFKTLQPDNMWCHLLFLPRKWELTLGKCKARWLIGDIEQTKMLKSAAFQKQCQPLLSIYSFWQNHSNNWLLAVCSAH